MADKRAGIEASAISLLKEAVEMDMAQRFTEALVCYRQGIGLLMDCLRTITDESKKLKYRQKIEEYMERAEKLKQHMEKVKEEGKYHEQIRIEANSTGHSLENTLGRFFDEHVVDIEVDDPYIRTIHQVYNFVRFCELVIKKAKNTRRIKLTTGLEENEQQQQGQRTRLEELRKSLRPYSIELDLVYSSTLHDREIRLDNGWIIKIGRGFDYLKAAPGKFAVGFCDMDLRPCHETTIDIFHRKHTKDDS